MENESIEAGHRGRPYENDITMYWFRSVLDAIREKFRYKEVDIKALYLRGWRG